jgi:hypothetical protein
MRIRRPFSFHRNESSIPSLEWNLSKLALRLVTCGTAETDSERLLSMQRKIAGLHGTRFGRPSMEARLKEWSNRPMQVQVSLGAMGGGDELDKSDADELSSR